MNKVKSTIPERRIDVIIEILKMSFVVLFRYVHSVQHSNVILKLNN